MIFLVIYVLLSIALGFLVSGLQDWADVKSKPLLIAGFGFHRSAAIIVWGLLGLNDEEMSGS